MVNGIKAIGPIWRLPGFVGAVWELADKVQQSQLEPAEITESVVADHLDTRHWLDPDLLTPTSGEMRDSNFLLLQISYAEFVVTPTVWPDFWKP